MRKKVMGETVKIWLSEKDTYNFSRNWPCSTLKNKRIYAEFFKGDIVDLSINNKTSINYDGYELQVLIKDALEEKGIFKNE